MTSLLSLRAARAAKHPTAPLPVALATSFGLEPHLLRELFPFHRFALDIALERFGRGRYDVQADRRQPVVDLRQVRGLDRDGVQPLNDRSRRLRGRDQSEPADSLEAGIARFGDRRYLGRDRHALLSRDREQLELACLGVAR